MASAVNLRFCCDPRAAGSIEEILEVVTVMPSGGADVCRSLISVLGILELDVRCWKGLWMILAIQ